VNCFHGVSFVLLFWGDGSYTEHRLNAFPLSESLSLEFVASLVWDHRGPPHITIVPLCFCSKLPTSGDYYEQSVFISRLFTFQSLCFSYLVVFHMHEQKVLDVLTLPMHFLCSAKTS
jgi:hypothetical protein